MAITVEIQIGQKIWGPNQATRNREKPDRFPFIAMTCNDKCQNSITGWWLTYPSEKYESQLRL